MRISSVALVALFMTGCQDKQTAGNVEAPAIAEMKIPCALAGAEALADDCTVEREAGAAGTILTLHHPDGGFRRVTVTANGHGVAATDGAEPASIAVVGNAQIEITIGHDRYRLPATIKATRPA